MTRKFITLLFTLLLLGTSAARAVDYKYQTELYVNPDGSAEFTTITDALEQVRAYMDYTATIHLAPGVYHEKVVIPSWLKNVVIEGEDPAKTVITFDHHANINSMGTFRSYTMRIDGSDITLKNLTIENAAPELGQAVAVHTEGSRLHFVNCRLLGNQDTLFTGGEDSCLLFDNCHIEGTTDFIFGGATALFRHCTIHSRRNSYITAASTPKGHAVGYVFDSCKLTAAPGVDKVYLGRPWRPYAHTMFINCDMGKHIVAEGWQAWSNKDSLSTTRYGEYGSKGPGAVQLSKRVSWSVNPDAAEAARLTDPAVVFAKHPEWVATLNK